MAIIMCKTLSDQETVMVIRPYSSCRPMYVLMYPSVCHYNCLKSLFSFSFCKCRIKYSSSNVKCVSRMSESYAAVGIQLISLETKL
jgi:hypothetical protein